MNRNFPIIALLISSALLQAKADDTYDSKKMEFQEAPIYITEIKGEVFCQKQNAPDREKVTERKRITQQTEVVTGNKSRAVLLFSNGACLALGENSELIINEFCQAGGFDLNLSPGDGKTVVDGTVIPLGSIPREPSYSHTKIFLAKGTMYAQVKKLRKKSYFFSSTPVGTAKIIGTTWRETVKTEPGDLKLAMKIELQEGLIEFAPLDTESKKFPRTFIHPQHELLVNATFQTPGDLQLASHLFQTSPTGIDLNLNINLEMSSFLDRIRDPDFDGFVEDYLPIGREDNVSLTGTPLPNDTGFEDSSFDQGTGTVGTTPSTTGGGGGGGGGATPTPTPVPTPNPPIS